MLNFIFSHLQAFAKFDICLSYLCGVRHQSEAERVRATLRNAIGEILGLPVLGLLDLLRIQVSVLKSSMQIFEGDTLHHLPQHLQPQQKHEGQDCFDAINTAKLAAHAGRMHAPSSIILQHSSDTQNFRFRKTLDGSLKRLKGKASLTTQ